MHRGTPATMVSKRAPFIPNYQRDNGKEQVKTAEIDDEAFVTEKASKRKVQAQHFDEVEFIDIKKAKTISTDGTNEQFMHEAGYVDSIWST